MWDQLVCCSMISVNCLMTFCLSATSCIKRWRSFCAALRIAHLSCFHTFQRCTIGLRTLFLLRSIDSLLISTWLLIDDTFDIHWVSDVVSVTELNEYVVVHDLLCYANWMIKRSSVLLQCEQEDIELVCDFFPFLEECHCVPTISICWCLAKEDSFRHVP